MMPSNELTPSEVKTIQSESAKVVARTIDMLAKA
jgi:hypothetical protein